MKTLRNFLAIGAIGFIGNPTIPVVDYEPQPQRQQQTENYSFDKFGEIPIRRANIILFEKADMDGDGDLDVIVGARNNYGLDSRIVIYENKMPQKTGEQR